jgi:hypothetical protein
MGEQPLTVPELRGLRNSRQRIRSGGRTLRGADPSLAELHRFYFERGLPMSKSVALSLVLAASLGLVACQGKKAENAANAADNAAMNANNAADNAMNAAMNASDNATMNASGNATMNAAGNAM